MARIAEAGRLSASDPGMGRRHVIKALYDFATDGGGTGDITLRSNESIPSGAIILDALIHVDTVLTSGGAATVAIKVEGAADINAADLISGAPWSSAGAKRGDFVATTAPIKTTAERSVVATIGAAALTAGKFWVAVEFVTFESET